MVGAELSSYSRLVPAGVLPSSIQHRVVPSRWLVTNRRSPIDDFVQLDGSVIGQAIGKLRTYRGVMPCEVSRVHGERSGNGLSSRSYAGQCENAGVDQPPYGMTFRTIKHKSHP